MLCLGLLSLFSFDRQQFVILITFALYIRKKILCMDLIAQIRDKMTSERLMFIQGVITNENSMPLLMLIEKDGNSEFGPAGRKTFYVCT